MQAKQLKPAGFWITFEGIEGCGKSTQCQLTLAALQQRGMQVRATREPGGTILGEKIRDLLLHTQAVAIHPSSELLLFSAARAQHLQDVIRPCLQSPEQILLCDRFTDATYAYQCGGHGLDKQLFEQITEAVVGNWRPQLTILLDLEVSVAMQRLKARSHQAQLDRIETFPLAFHQRVRQAYLELAAAQPQRIQRFDATLPVPQLQEAIITCIWQRHQLWNQACAKS